MVIFMATSASSRNRRTRSRSAGDPSVEFYHNRTRQDKQCAGCRSRSKFAQSPTSSDELDKVKVTNMGHSDVEKCMKCTLNEVDETSLEERIKAIVFEKYNERALLKKSDLIFKKSSDLIFKHERKKVSIGKEKSDQFRKIYRVEDNLVSPNSTDNVLRSSDQTKSLSVSEPLPMNTLPNTNITDAEKIYHRLKGISKLSRHKTVYVSKQLGVNFKSWESETRKENGNNPKKRNSICGVSVDNVESVPKSAVVLKSAKDLQHGAQMLPKGAKITVNPKLSKSQNPAQLVLRQCRIGCDVAFGLVQVPNKPNGNGYSEGHGLVTIRMKPDDQGRFGFNVKGGADQGMPIIVSRVAPGTPADIAIPRLNEGDQVLFINGRDVSQHTHEQVVMFIRASRETHSGELVLIVRPNVYVSEDTTEEPEFSYIPESHQITSSAMGANALEASLMLLQESLESGAALAQFEQLYRKKPGMTMNAARLDANIAKNRYRDISPYDQTRVILKEISNSGGDYINANYVNMEIPGSGIVNRYIAAQGPLPKTCTDFWQMIWEQHSSLVVMLTTKVERGRVKCHQYWPEMYETMDYGALQITCVKEEETTSFAFREFNLTNVETNEERHISHMQYIAWPDHGVPDDPADFLEFVLKVRQRRMGMVEPTVVHCSAGIGRTGVLITMETAMCLVEANQPVYPLSIVRQMRDQRAMLIQTASQYKFVCEAILRVYNEGLVKPLEDYQR